jgi:hypothetical protein
MEKGVNMKNALANSFSEDMKLIKELSSLGDINSIRASRLSAVLAEFQLERKVEKKQKEWIFWQTLSDFCSPLGEHAKAVHAAEECYKIKPSDPRSSYGLATALRMLIMEINAGEPNFNPIEIPPNILGFFTMYQNFDPEKGKKELEKLNLTVEQAAKRAIALFEESIILGLDEKNEEITRQTLAVMHVQFPNLNAKIKPTSNKARRITGKSINPTTLKALELQISSFLHSYKRFQDSIDGISLFDGNMEISMTCSGRWHRQISQEKVQLSAIRELWPEGSQFIKKIDEFIITQEKIVDNSFKWNYLLHGGHNYNIKDIREASREYLSMNRELGMQMDSLLVAAFEILRKETGLDVYNFTME